MRLLLSLLLFTTVAQAAPRTLIDLNQFDMQYVNDLPKLKADWCMASVSATPELRGAALKSAIKTLGCRIVLTTDGGIDPAQLLDIDNWTGAPRNLGLSKALVNSAGVPVNYVMLYTEFNRNNEHSTLLTNPEYEYASSQLGGAKILPLTRAWDEIGKAKLKGTLTLPANKFPGVYLEVAVDIDYLKQVKACEILKYANKMKRFTVILLSGKTPSTTYAADVYRSCRYLRGTCPVAVENSVMGVAIYEYPQKGINWIGGPNSVSEAMKKLKECLK